MLVSLNQRISITVAVTNEAHRPASDHRTNHCTGIISPFLDVRPVRRHHPVPSFSTSYAPCNTPRGGSEGQPPRQPSYALRGDRVPTSRCTTPKPTDADRWAKQSAGQGRLEMNAKTLLNRKLYLAFGAATLILLGLGASSYRDLIESSESNLWVRHTHEVLESLHDLSSAVDSGESSYRGYVLTGKESYVESWRANRLRARTDVATIGGLTTDNRFQQSRMPGLESLTAAKLQFGEMIIDLNRTHGFG